MDSGRNEERNTDRRSQERTEFERGEYSVVEKERSCWDKMRGVSKRGRREKKVRKREMKIMAYLQ